MPSKLDSLAIFAPTADQRFMFGPELFLKTHYPISMRRFQQGQQTEVHEGELLAKLLDNSTGIVGNRVYILYAAPGSGKSELIRWLYTQIKQQSPAQAKTMIRVDRTDLDVLSIVERFHYLLSTDYFQQQTHQRWQLVRRKPRTLSKLLVLSALENLLDSDDMINALYYRLLNAIQPHIEQSLNIQQTENVLPQAELLSRETWETIKTETALPISVDYEQLRWYMLSYFQQHLLEGFDIVEALQGISNHIVQQHGQRPILLVDDLVQSLNLFATDLLDYLITLEAGQWDVVIGLTPAAFETSQRGRELLQRIAYLDTIDDRVEKLWLSDETGHASYVLTEDNCDQFAATYLQTYHHLNGLTNISTLYPFNREILIRLYRGLPTNKGKVRYFLKHLRLILEQVAKGEPLLNAIKPFARTEYVARCDNHQLANVCELFGPLMADPSSNKVVLSQELLTNFDLSQEQTNIPIEPLVRQTISSRIDIQQSPITNEEKIAIRDWLAGELVNRQMFRQLRQGAARILRKIGIPDSLHHAGIAKPKGMINWRKPLLDVHPPIQLEGIDTESEGILLSRKIGFAAFELYHYAKATGKDVKDLEDKLMNETNLLPFFFTAEEYYQTVFNRLEKQLGITIEKMAWGFYLWGIIHFDKKSTASQRLPAKIYNTLIDYPQYYVPLNSDQIAYYWRIWQQLFDDFFKLRQNIYDNNRLWTLYQTETVDNLFKQLSTINPHRISSEYRCQKQLLSDALTSWQTIMKRTVKLNEQSALSPTAQRWMMELDKRSGDSIPLNELPLEVIVEFFEHSPKFVERLEIRLL